MCLEPLPSDSYGSTLWWELPEDPWDELISVVAAFGWFQVAVRVEHAKIITHMRDIYIYMYRERQR